MPASIMDWPRATREVSDFTGEVIKSFVRSMRDKGHRLEKESQRTPALQRNAWRAGVRRKAQMLFWV
jgi:hypothetical protein